MPIEITTPEGGKFTYNDAVGAAVIAEINRNGGDSSPITAPILCPHGLPEMLMGKPVICDRCATDERFADTGRQCRDNRTRAAIEAVEGRKEPTDA